MNNKDLLEVADALTDILYVTYGAGHAFGINLDKCFEEVQNSNMSKLDDNGKPIYNEHGKVMKGPNYFKPDLKKIYQLNFKFKIYCWSAVRYTTNRNPVDPSFCNRFNCFKTNVSRRLSFIIFFASLTQVLSFYYSYYQIKPYQISNQ